MMKSEWQESILRRGLGPLVKFWFPKIVVCLFIYFLSVRIIGGLFSGTAFLSAKSGSLEFGNALDQHPYVRALSIGVLAGLVPMRIWLAISGVFKRNIENYLRELKTESLHAWLWAFFCPLFLLDFLGWILNWVDMSARNASVLQTSSSYHLSDLVRGYFSTDCSWTGLWPMEPSETKTSFRCMMHIQMISLWLMSVGYSVAPFVIRKMSAQSAEPLSDSEIDNIEGPVMEGNTDRNEDTY